VRHSNTLGIGAIGTGAAGSFNYAAQQKLERKNQAVAKAGKASLLGRAAAKVNTRLDERALRTAEQIMPTGHTLPSGAQVRGHELEGRGKFGGRDVYTHVYGPDARGVHRPVGYVRTKQLPTKHVMVTGMQMNPKQRGKGYGTDLLETAQRNVRGAKTPGFIWRSAGYKADEGVKNTPTGHRTWQRKGVKYVPGMAFGKPSAAEGNVLRSEGFMNRKEKAKAIGHMTAARLGATTPDKARNLPTGAQELSNETGQQWWARVKGGQPMLGRTRRAVGAGTVGGAAVYGHARYEENKHPRTFGGKYSSKPVAKRDDRFLRGYKERISPDAERGYKHLKQGRNEQAAEAVGSATMTGLGGWLLHHELKHGKVLHKNPGALIAAAGTVASAANARQNAAGARRYHQKIQPIKAKARSRRAQGLYGPGRGLEPVDMTSARAKALSKAMEVPMDARATNLAQAMAVTKAIPGGKLVRRAATSFKRPPARITLPDRPPLGSTGTRKEPALNRFGLSAEQHRDAQIRAIDARTDARAAAGRKPVRVDRPTAYRREGEPLHFGPAR
jgi:GNAT superfamily N-acetyltransferase